MRLFKRATLNSASAAPLQRLLVVTTAIGRPGKTQQRWLRILILAGFIVFVLQWLYRLQRERRYDPIIVAAARRYAVDPALVKAVIWRESHFDASARGRVGELGLMQVREAAARDWATAEKKIGFNNRLLIDPDTNIHAGSWYLAQLLKRYRSVDDPLPYALADYNAGRAQVLRWTQGRARTNSAEFLVKMDFPGTRQYIRAIQKRYEYYRRALSRDK